MKFKADQPIFLQLMADIEERIIDGRLREEERVPAVRDFALEVEVNPNTVVRSFSELEAAGVIYKKRGLGYFVSFDARKTILQRRRQLFLQEELPATVRTMRLLGVGLDAVAALLSEDSPEAANTGSHT